MHAVKLRCENFQMAKPKQFWTEPKNVQVFSPQFHLF